MRFSGVRTDGLQRHGSAEMLTLVLCKQMRVFPVNRKMAGTLIRRGEAGNRTREKGFEKEPVGWMRFAYPPY